MLVGKKYKIESDSMNVILSQKIKRVKKDTGKKYDDWQIEGYFSTVPGALHELISQGIRDTQLTDLKTISDKIEELHEIINNLPLKRASGARETPKE